MENIDDIFEKIIKTRLGMFDSLICAFMEETGLKASEIELIEKVENDKVTHFYARKRENKSIKQNECFND